MLFLKQVGIYLCNFSFQLILLQSYRYELFFFPTPINIKLLISYDFNDTIPTFFTMFHHKNMGDVLANGPTGEFLCLFLL